jgi:cytochrome oxidase Cu insertion factor (SCO1/SenC/PrrC family)
MNAAERIERPEPMGTRRLRRRLLGAATLLLAATTMVLATPLLRPAQALPVLDTVGGDFTLPSTLGRDVALEDYRGRLVLLNFGFAQCPDVCPAVLTRMRALLLDLAALGIEPQPLFVTIDPERDTVEVLERYVAHFHPALVGLTGPAAKLADVAEQYRVYAEKEALDSDADYGFAHSSHIYLIDGHGRVRAMFGASHTLERMTAEVRSLAPPSLLRLWRSAS